MDRGSTVKDREKKKKRERERESFQYVICFDFFPSVDSFAHSLDRIILRIVFRLTHFVPEFPRSVHSSSAGVFWDVGYGTKPTPHGTPRFRQRKGNRKFVNQHPLARDEIWQTTGDDGRLRKGRPDADREDASRITKCPLPLSPTQNIEKRN